MYIANFCLVLLFVVPQIIAAPCKSKDTCGYESCNLGIPGKLNIHIVPHTHDDVGWLKTVDEYYYGSRRDITGRGVQYIIDSVISALLENPERRFIYVEMAYFWRWWNEQTDDMRNTVKELVNEGRLEFISGGWCMHDEASTHYHSMIDQHSLGAEFLRDTFGDCARPKIGWQIDPFGHSRESASLFAQMGFDGLFFGRMDYQDRIFRTVERKLEMVWQASANLDRQSWLFTGVLPHGYSAPFTFCFDAECGDAPIMDDPRLHDYNVEERVEGFIRAAIVEAATYVTDHLIMTFGDDFAYQNAPENFKNLDKLIKYVNMQQQNGSIINAFYSTPSCYLYALNKAGKQWSTKSDDFFPYASVPFSYWTGYYTSRAALKRYERYGNNILQATRHLNGLSQINQRNSIFRLSEAMGLLQHHDAVSGTEKQHVADDYAQRLSDGIDQAIKVINNAYAKLLPKQSQTSIPSQFLCPLTNISECLPIERQNQFTLTLWNPTIHPVTTYSHVPVTQEYQIYDPTGKLVVAEYLPVSPMKSNIPGRTSTAQYEYVFEAKLPALGFNTYYFEAKPSEKKAEHKKITVTQNQECTLQNAHLKVEFNGFGDLKRITNLDKLLVTSFTTQGFYWYASFPGDRTPLPASGAYIFRPLYSEALPVSPFRTINCTITDTVQKASITFNEWASQEIILYPGAKTVEVEWRVGPIPVHDNIGKEIIMRYDTDIKNEITYHTDSNGREVLERNRDSRPTWPFFPDEKISSNYYPINSRIWIEDGYQQLTVLTDRSEGGGSIYDGSIEIMLHRRILHDDSLGVGEPLNETAYGTGLVVTGKHYLIFDEVEASARLHRVNAQELYLQPMATYALPQTSSYTDYSNLYHQTWSALSDKLPVNLHLLTFDQLDSKRYLVRVEHFFELNEDTEYSKPITFDLQILFQNVGTINNMTELILTANMPLSQLHRLDWITTNGESSHYDIPREQSLKETTIKLKPMQIRTFEVNLV